MALLMQEIPQAANGMHETLTQKERKIGHFVSAAQSTEHLPNDQPVPFARNVIAKA